MRVPRGVGRGRMVDEGIRSDYLGRWRSGNNWKLALELHSRSLHLGLRSLALNRGNHKFDDYRRLDYRLNFHYETRIDRLHLLRHRRRVSNQIRHDVLSSLGNNVRKQRVHR